MTKWLFQLTLMEWEDNSSCTSLPPSTTPSSSTPLSTWSFSNDVNMKSWCIAWKPLEGKDSVIRTLAQLVSCNHLRQPRCNHPVKGSIVITPLTCWNHFLAGLTLMSSFLEAVKLVGAPPSRWDQSINLQCQQSTASTTFRFSCVHTILKSNWYISNTHHTLSLFGSKMPFGICPSSKISLVC